MECLRQHYSIIVMYYTTLLHYGIYYTILLQYDNVLNALYNIMLGITIQHYNNTGMYYTTLQYVLERT